MGQELVNVLDTAGVLAEVNQVQSMMGHQGK